MTEPLLLLPGMMCDSRLFTPQLDAFTAQRTVAVGALVGSPSIAGLAQAMLSASPTKFALAGLSMGGIVAMEMVRLAPERITRLALLDTNSRADTDERRAIREHQLSEVRSGGLRRIMREEMKPDYLADGANTGQILDLCMAMAESLGERVFEDQTRALQRRPDQLENLPSITVPTLVLCGEKDTLCTVQQHELIASRIASSRLTVVPAAGHLPTLEQPELTNRELDRWLNE
ncbi:MAG: alpha/beta hydrolase [Pseudomonadota bacterium]